MACLSSVLGGREGVLGLIISERASGFTRLPYYLE